MPECGVEKASKKAPQGLPHGEALLVALFPQLEQRPANHPKPLIGALLSERKSLLERTSPIPSASSSQTAPRAGSGSAVIGTTQRTLVMIVSGGSTQKNFFVRRSRPKALSWLPTAETLRRPIIVVGRNDPVRDVEHALGTVKGFKLRICIEGEKELQILGCGSRIVTCQFRGNKVLLNHNGKVATMKRKPSRNCWLLYEQ
jgi:hypothetical protein